MPQNYGQTTQVNPLLNYRKLVQDDQLLNYRRSVPDHSLRQTVHKEDSVFLSRYTPNIPRNLPQIHGQVITQNSNTQNTHKNGYRIPEHAENDSLYNYRQSENKQEHASDKRDEPTLNHLKKDESNLKHRQILKDSLQSNTGQTGISVEERSEKGEVRRSSGTQLLKMSSEEQELMLLDALHQKTNSSRRGFESNLADMLGKSESIFITVPQAASIQFA
jgi:hypothetical protein